MRQHRGFRRSLFAVVAGSIIALTGATVAMAAPPANTTLPSITGTPKVGETLTAQNGTWTNSPTAFQYQWQRCGGAGAGCVAVPGAVQKTYLLTAADVNRTMRVQVLAVNADGSSTARSGPTASRCPEHRSTEHRPSDDHRRPPGRRGADGGGRHLDEHPDRVRVRVAAVRHRRRPLRSRSRREREDLRRPDGRPRLPAARQRHGAQLGRLRLGALQPDGHRRADRADHEHPADADDRLGPLPRRPRLREVPDLRRHREEPDHPGDGLAACPRLADPALHHADRTEPVRGLHPQLGPGRALPRQGPLHGHAPGPRHLRVHERARPADLQPVGPFGGAPSGGGAPLPLRA